MSKPLIETFTCDGWQWNINLARQLVEDRAPVEMAVAEFAPMLDDVHTFDISVMDCDLTDPVLVCDLADPVDGHTRLLIDGWHRLKTAVAEGVKTLPALVLTVEEALSISGREPAYAYDDEEDPYVKYRREMDPYFDHDGEFDPDFDHDDDQ